MTEERDSEREPPLGRLDEEAARWSAIMHGPDAGSRRGEFEAWLRMGAMHRRAYNRAEEIYLLAPKYLPADEARPQVPVVLARPTGLRTGAFAAVVVALAGTAIIVSADRLRPERTTVAGAENAFEVRTPPLRKQDVSLADGTSVSLGPGSVLTVALDTRRRKLGLVSGKARFDIAPDRRPFLVEAGGKTVMPTGRVVEIAVVSQVSMTVHPISGAAEVRAGANGLGARTRVPQGESRSWSLPPPPASDAPKADARSEQPGTVGELVAMSNAKFPGRPQLHLLEGDLAAVRLAGRFGIHDQGTVAGQLEALLGLTVDRRDRGRIILSRADQRRRVPPSTP